MNNLKELLSIGEKVKVINLDGISLSFKKLEDYIGKTVEIHDIYSDETFAITFYDPDFESFDYDVNSGVAFNLHNVEILDNKNKNNENINDNNVDNEVSKLSLTQILQQIRKIIGNEYADVKLEIWSGKEINFCIYETEIVLGIENKSVYVNTEVLRRTAITYDEMNELTQIMKLIQDNIDSVLECVKEV
jgi:hypothetical protein